jgi:N-acetylglucosamine repressor
MAEIDPTSIADVPKTNRALIKKKILGVLYKNGPGSITDISKLFRLSIPTAASIINELTSEGWVGHTGMGNSAGGRPPVLYGLQPHAKFVVGIDVSRRNSRLAVFTLANSPVGNIVEIPIGLDNSNNITQIITDHVSMLLEKNDIHQSKLLGYGIAMPGLHDVRKGINYSYQLPGNTSVATLFSETLDGQVCIENDTKSMALGEAWFGWARGIKNALCLNVGTGIGMGIIIDGKIFRGHSGFSGEFGHIQLVADGKLCYCGKTGCLETVASGAEIIRKAKESIAGGMNSLISDLVSDVSSIDLKTIIQAASMGDTFSIQLLEDASEHLARALAMVIHLLNPQMVIIGGSLSAAGPLISEPIRHKLTKYTIGQILQDVSIQVSDLGRDAILMGTIPNVISNFFDLQSDNY